jgi:hypothetical protein
MKKIATALIAIYMTTMPIEIVYADMNVKTTETAYYDFTTETEQKI